MRRNTKWTGLMALAPVCGLVVALASAPAHANAILTVDDGGANSVTISDGGTGVLSYSGTLGSWLLTLDYGMTAPALGTSHQPDMHLTTGALGTGTLNVSFRDDSFVGTGSNEFLAGIGGLLAEGASLTGSAWLTDASGNRVANLATFGPFGSWSFSDTQSAVETVGGSYGLELFATLTQSQYGSSSFDASVAVPEPPTFALFGAGLLASGLFLFCRRRMDTRTLPRA